MSSHYQHWWWPYFEYHYDKNGNLTKRQDVLQGRDSTNFAYDIVNRVKLCEQTGRDATGLDDQVFSSSDYDDYDPVNNLKSISRHEDGDKGERFVYDDANQLQSVTYKAYIGPRGPEQPVKEVAKDANRESVAVLEADPDREPLARLVAGADVPTPEMHTVTYTNDPITRRSMNNNGSVTNYTPNFLNQYIAVSGYPTPAYDGNFNLSGYNGWTYVYDADNRLISANASGHHAAFLYDGLGRCVRRTIDGAATVFTYDEWKPIVEWNVESDGSLTYGAWNLYGPGADEILVRHQINTGGYIHYHLDAMGNVQFLLGADNLGLEKYTYDAFGQPTITDWDGHYQKISQYGNRFMFTGREYLYTLGLYDYRHRLYHPGLGRFIQTDPIGFKGDPMNLYRYCGGNPIGHSDPTGLNPEPYNLTSNGKGDWDFDNGRVAWAQINARSEPGPVYGGGPPAAAKGKLNWQDTGNRNIKQETVKGDDGTDTDARTYPKLKISASSDRYGKLDTLNVALSQDVKYASMKNGKVLTPTQLASTRRKEPAHYNEMHAWGMDEGRDIAQGVARQYSGRSAIGAVSATEAALRPSFNQAVHDTWRAHDWYGGDHTRYD